MIKTRTKKAKSDPTVEDQIAEFSDTILACRDVRHAWAVDAPYYKVPMQGARKGQIFAKRIIACMRCDTQRVEIYRIKKHNVERVSVFYKHPEGYSLHGVKRGTNTVSMVRREQIRRLWND